MKPFSMSRKTVCTVIVTLFLLSTLMLKVGNKSAKAEPESLTVPDDYLTIQEAINAANLGDTIFVRNGKYYENLVVNKPLIIAGESKENTIIDGSGENKTVIEITASNVVISGFTVQNSSQVAGTSYAGIKISGRACNVTDNYVIKTKMGIFVTSQKSRITKNVVKNNGQGIALYSSSEVTVEANNVSANTVGISLALSFNNMIMGNMAVNSSTGGHGIILSSNSFNNTICVNELMNNYHGMWLSSSSNNSVFENTIANNKLLGIELANSPSNIFYHNNFINNGLSPHAPSIKHVTIDSKSENIWDNSYESNDSGGNYWHDYTDVDEKRGLNQDQIGSDEIWDNSYVINENNRDRYPSVRPYGDISHIILDKETLTAWAGPNKTVKVGTPVSFDARGSTGNIAAYEWAFGDETSGTGATLNHTYHETGTYTVTLTIRGVAGNIDEDQLTVIITAGDAPQLFDLSSLWISVLAGAIVIVMVVALFWKRSAKSKRKKKLGKIRSRKHR